MSALKEFLDSKPFDPTVLTVYTFDRWEYEEKDEYAMLKLFFRTSTGEEQRVTFFERDGKISRAWVLSKIVGVLAKTANVQGTNAEILNGAKGKGKIALRFELNDKNYLDLVQVETPDNAEFNNVLSMEANSEKEGSDDDDIPF